MQKTFGLLIVFAFIIVAQGARGDEGKIVAVVNGNSITETTYIEEYNKLQQNIRSKIKHRNEKEKFLDALVARELLIQEAKRRNIENNVDVAKKINAARTNIIIEALLQYEVERKPLTDDILRKYYHDNIGNFKTGERVRVKHIVFKEKVKADSAIAKADAAENFDALIKSSAAGGDFGADLGFIERGNFNKDFEAAAFSAQPGIVVGPVKTEFGYHIILVSEKRLAGVKGFDEIKHKLYGELKERNQRDSIEKLVADLKKHGKVQIYKDNIP